jgi:hypothetical protein
MEISGLSRIEWKWDEVKGKYYRYQQDEEFYDSNGDEKVYADNIIVTPAEYPEATKLDPAGNPTYDTIMNNSGKCVILRDGKIFDGKTKISDNLPPKYFDEYGVEIPLKAGKTWVEVPQDYVEIKTIKNKK